VVAVDLLSFSVKTRIELPAAPVELHATPEALYALTPAAKAVEEIDPAGRVRRKAHGLGGTPLAAKLRGRQLWCLLEGALTPLGGKAITLPGRAVAFDVAREAPLAAVSLEDGRLALVDLEKRGVRLSEKLDESLGAVHFRSDSKAVFVAERAAKRLTSIEAASGAVIARMPLALSPEHVCGNADGGQLFLTGEGRDAVVIAYTFRHEIAQTSLSGRKPGAMAASGRKGVVDDPQFLFVANPQAGSVTVFDVTTQRVVAVTGVGAEPGTIVVTPDQQYALVLNRASADMAVIRIAAITGGKSRSAPLFTMIPVGAKPVSAVVVPA